MLESMFSSSISIPKLNTPKLVVSNLGYIIESNNLNTSVGWRNKNETVWNIYSENRNLLPNDDFEILLFQPGYEILINSFKN